MICYTKFKQMKFDVVMLVTNNSVCLICAVGGWSSGLSNDENEM